MTPHESSSSNAVWSATDLTGSPHEAPDKPQRVRAMFAGIARSYDLNNRLHSLGRDQAWRRAAVRMAGIGPGDHVLDGAGGTGDLAEAACRARPERVVGVDFTEPRQNLIVDVSNGLGHGLSEIAALVAVSKFKSLVLSGACP